MNRLFNLAAFSCLLWSAGTAQTWAPVNGGTSSRLYAVYYVNPDTGWIGGEGSTIRKTTDGGATWTAQSGSRNLTAFSFMNSQTGWAVGGSGGVGVILKTTNGGTTWVSQGSSLPVLWGVSFISPDRGWAVGAGGTILNTTNGGSTWSGQSSGTSNVLVGVQFTDSLKGWASGSGSTVLHTTNGGATWTPQNIGITMDINRLEFVSSTKGWVVGYSGTILKTTNGGSTWSAQTSGVSAILNEVSFLDSLNGYIAGFEGVILKTTNGGASWAQQPSTVTSTLNSVQILKNGSAWAVGDVGVLLKTLVPTAPSYFTYSQNPVSYPVGIQISPNVPSISGSTPLTFEAGSPLPAGLTLNPATGVISGTPTTISGDIRYSITATNSVGSTMMDVIIGIHSPSAVSLATQRSRENGLDAPYDAKGRPVGTATRALIRLR